MPGSGWPWTAKATERWQPSARESYNGRVQPPPLDVLGGRRAEMLRFLYRLYERRLLKEVGTQPMPRHVGIILDGNRRYGLDQGLDDPRQIYDIGARKLDQVLDWCGELRIAAVTLWVFSTANLGRTLDEISGIF